MKLFVQSCPWLPLVCRFKWTKAMARNERWAKRKHYASHFFDVQLSENLVGLWFSCVKRAQQMFQLDNRWELGIWLLYWLLTMLIIHSETEWTYTCAHTWKRRDMRQFLIATSMSYWIRAWQWWLWTFCLSVIFRVFDRKIGSFWWYIYL